MLKGRKLCLVASMGSSWQDSWRTQMPSVPLLRAPGSPSLPECLEVNRLKAQGLLRKKLRCSKEISRVSQPHPPQGGKSGPKSSSRLNWAGFRMKGPNFRSAPAYLPQASQLSFLSAKEPNAVSPRAWKNSHYGLRGLEFQATNPSGRVNVPKATWFRNI